MKNTHVPNDTWNAMCYKILLSTLYRTNHIVKNEILHG